MHQSYETSATVDEQVRVQLAGVPFAPGTQVEVVISPKSGPAEADGDSASAARARMRELFASVRGFRMAPKIAREDLYERRP